MCGCAQDSQIDIHPDNKKDVGERMALAARKLAYGDDVVYSGPLYKEHKIEIGRNISLSLMWEAVSRQVTERH